MRPAALLCVAGALFAQSVDKPADEWILSSEPLKQAWAAHWIAERKLTALIPELLRVVESPVTSADGDAARFAALDTLIQLNAEVPQGDLELLADRFPTEVLILASRSSEDTSALLLKLLDRPHNQAAFAAVGNLLTPKRIAGFAKAAMKEFCQLATVWVYNPDQTERMGQGVWAGDAFGKRDPPRADWPETGSYTIVDSAKPMPGWTLLANGTRAVSFIRTVGKGYTDHGFDYSSEGSDNNSCLRAEEFLAIYLETAPPKLLVRSQAQLSLSWTTDRAFEAAVRAFIAEQRVRFAIVAGQLAARGYLTAEEATQARLNLKISAEDARQHDRTPLPDIGAWVKDPN